MSLLKAIEHGKEHRQPRRAKWITRYGLYTDDCFWHSPKVCQCPRCRDGRFYRDRKHGLATYFNAVAEGYYVSSAYRYKIVNMRK